MKPVDSFLKSQKMKTENANRKKLDGIAREIYLAGLAGLKNAEKVAESGNNGSGFSLRYKIDDK